MEDNKNYIRVERHKWPDEIAAEKKRTRKRFVIVLCCIVCFISGFALSAFSNTSVNGLASSSKNTDSEKFNEIYNIMKNEWYFGKDIKNLGEFLMENAISGLTTNKYDAHTNYLASDSASQYMQKLEGSMVGVGISYTKVGDDNVIAKVYLDSPAEKAGIKEGDILTKIDGLSLEGKSLDEVGELAKGEEGSIVTFTINRNGEELTFDITRATLSLTVYGYVRDQVGILELSSFSERTHEEVEAYFKQFKKENINSIVIDMRDNTGGYLNTVVKIASMLMEEGKIVVQDQDKDGKVTQYKATGGTKYAFDQIVLLVNKNTASASEALTICLKEQLGVKVVGTTTYGKGTEQISKVFTDGTYLKYTVAEWLSPNGNSINVKGIKPDYEIENDKALTTSFDYDDVENAVDSVGTNVQLTQNFLKFLGYNIDRTDGYYSNTTLEAVKKFQSEQGISSDGIINKYLISKLYAKTIQMYSSDRVKYDVQLTKAIEVANGK